MSQQQSNPMEKLQESFNIAYMASKTLAWCFLPFLRSGFGIEAVKLPAFFAFILLCLMTAADRAMNSMFYLWIVVLAYRRLESSWMYKNEEYVISTYEGDPWVAQFLYLGDKFGRLIGEPVIVAVAGLLLSRNYPNASTFFFWGAGGLCLSAMIEFRAIEREIMMMRDGEALMRWKAQRYQER